MDIFRTSKIIFFLFFSLAALNPSTFALPTFLNKESKDQTNKRKLIFPNRENFSSNYIFEKNSLSSFDNNPKFALNKPISDSQELEIQSDDQYQENNVLYAEGNVLAIFKGNSLNADNLIYDKLNQKFDAFGNIKLILGKQIFLADKISYDFKSEKGVLLQVKGLIKTENLIENININSSNPNEISSTLEEIRKVKVLYTPDGIHNWIFSTDKLIVENNQWFAKKAIFNNDLLESDQVEFRINNLKITPGEEQLKIQSAISFLVLEDKISIPFWFGKRELNSSSDSFEFYSKWYIGIDKLDKDGYFIGSRFNPINLNDDFSLKLKPQFLIERSIKGHTKSFVKKGDSVTAKKSKQVTSLEDYFALDSELDGKLGDWDLMVQKKLYSFDYRKFQDALRLNLALSKEIDFLNSKWNKSFY